MNKKQTMRERMARRLAAINTDPPGNAEDTWGAWLEDVDAVLDEMREPDEGMTNEVVEQGVMTGCCLVNASAARETWQWMIDYAKGDTQ